MTKKHLGEKSERVKQLFSCKVLDICVQAVVILFEVDVRL